MVIDKQIFFSDLRRVLQCVMPWTLESALIDVAIL